MSTRGFLGFVVEGTEKITYNHYDSYPGGLGATVTEWLASLNEDTAVRAREKAKALRLVEDDPDDEWYWKLRDQMGDPAQILEYGTAIDRAEFAYNSLFCEYGYLIDFDRMVLELYRGFRVTPPTRGRWATPERLAIEQQEYDEYAAGAAKNGFVPDRYYAVELAGTWPMFQPPTVETMEQAAEAADQERENA